MGAFDFLTSSAVSMTVSGNTGISPFLTLLLLGIIEKADPELLNMDEWIERLLSSWVSIVVLSVLTGLEFLGKCIPVIDEIIDSVEIFVVPVLSIFATLGTLGLLDLAQQEASDGGRRLIVNAALTFLKVFLVIIGIFLALAIHLFKMLIRLIGLTCCAGCCQPCITVVEVTCVLIGVLVSILIRPLAIATCIILAIAAVYAIKRKFLDKDVPENTPNGGAPAPAPLPDSVPSPQAPAQNSVASSYQGGATADIESPSSQSANAQPVTVVSVSVPAIEKPSTPDAG